MNGFDKNQNFYLKIGHYFQVIRDKNKNYIEIIKIIYIYS